MKTIIEIKKDYLRDMDLYPLSLGQEGETTNPQPDKCNNFNYRKNDGSPTYLMQHYTFVDFNETIKIFTTNESLSAHYVITSDGTIQEFVAPQYRAYHAGPGNLSIGSKLNPNLASNIIKDDLNSWSIGIENVNNGNEEFTPEQIEANVLLCEHLCNMYSSLNPKLMLSHADWLYDKIDPGPYFPYELLANSSEKYEVTRNFGIYPRKAELQLKQKPEEVLSYKEQAAREDIEHYQSLLREYGYDIDEEENGVLGTKTLQAVLAYNLHFNGPEILNDELKKQAWNDLWCNFSNYETRMLLSQLTENDVKCLADILDQY
ncbi:hypothetical protein H6P87_00782 [Rickettsia tillamookensis]|uniref:N-acetylmuramoyl-L-alanine amidase n=1 Tax=Rickettsia tillamookensis TaxID=2761623 RepID=A0A9E6MIE7_9RICK|nr:N-acetylmuramoyl-L-alanine amidase [Rickettsia tillamookensis]QQV75233.1 hypothetical protein H6P87_00782 [Rickettsia tillamookensis]